MSQTQIDAGNCGGSEPFALQVLGDSMWPEFEEGAIIIIDPAGVIENGCFVLAHRDDEYIFRQLVIYEGKHYLQPLNDLYETVEIPDLSCIHGVIVQKAGRRRKDHKSYVSLKRPEYGTEA